MENPKYLVRPHDSHIFSIDESNGCYRTYYKNPIPNQPNAYSHFTLDNLTTNYGFFAITEDEIPRYEAKNNQYHEWLKWANRSDGHGGSKGGSYQEFLKQFNIKAEK